MIVIFGKFHSEKNDETFFFLQTKKISRPRQNGRFCDFGTRPETSLGNRKFFFMKFNLVVLGEGLHPT